jgi:hypothetical protein
MAFPVKPVVLVVAACAFVFVAANIGESSQFTYVALPSEENDDAQSNDTNWLIKPFVRNTAAKATSSASVSSASTGSAQSVASGGSSTSASAASAASQQTSSAQSVSTASASSVTFPIVIFDEDQDDDRDDDKKKGKKKGGWFDGDDD